MSSPEERAVLGGMLLSSDVVASCIELLNAEDFADARFGLIFDTCVRLWEQGRPVDVISATEALGDDRLRVGAPVTLLELAQGCAVPASAPYYAELVAKAARLRRVGMLGVKLQQLAETSGDADEAIELAHAELTRAIRGAPACTDMGVLVQDSLEEYERDNAIPTAWQELDTLIHGWTPGRLYVLGSRPGVGKSAMGLCAALDVARRGKPVLVMSAEMSRIELGQRLISNACNVSLHAISSRKMSHDEWRQISSTRARLDKLPMFIDDRPGMRTSDVMSMSRRLVEDHRSLGLVVVDYLQLLVPPAHLTRRTREEQVAHITRMLRFLAQELKVPVLALAQLNRRAPNMPTMADLRESGEVEQAADVVILLHRQTDVFEDSNEPPDELKVMVPKNRQGTTGGFRLHWQGDHARVVTRRQIGEDNGP